MKWLQRISSKVVKIPQNVYPQLAMLADRAFDQFSTWFRLKPKHVVELHLMDLEFQSPYTFESDSIPVMITNKKYESGVGQPHAVFDAIARKITVFPVYHLFSAFENGQISRAEIQHNLYKSVVHEFTHALDPKLDYRTDIGARSFIDRITAKCDLALLAHLSQVCKKGISNDPDFNNILEYWNSHRMKYMREYLCKSTTSSLNRCSKEFDKSEKITNDQKSLVTEYVIDPAEVDAFMSMFIRELEFGLHSNSKKEADNLRLIKDWLVQPINGPRILPIIDHNGLFHINLWKQYPEIWKKFKQRLADFLSNYSKNKSYRSSNPRVILTPPPIG